MNQREMYELMKETGPVTVNQLVDIIYPDVKKYDRNTMQSIVTKMLRQLQKWGMVERIGWVRTSGGRNMEGVWAVME